MSEYYTGWIGLHLTGDREVAQGYIREARKLVGSQRAINGITGDGDEVFYKKVSVMADGTVVTLVHNNGIDNVQIHAPLKGPAPETPEGETHEISGDLTHEPLEGGGETPPSVRQFEPEPEVKLVKEEQFKYDKRVFCLLGDDSVVTSDPFHAQYFYAPGGMMIDDGAVFIIENIPIYRTPSDPIPNGDFNILTLDGRTMASINSIACIGSHVYFNASFGAKTVAFATMLGVFNTQFEVRTINMVDGGETAVGGFDPAQLPRAVPHVMLSMAGSDGVVLFVETAVQLLDPATLVQIAATATDLPSGMSYTSFTWQSHFIGNGAWAVWHHLTGSIEVQFLDGSAGFTIAAPIYPQFGHMASIAVMKDKSTVWIYDGFASDTGSPGIAGDLRVYRAGAWSGDQTPAEATQGFAMLYDPVSDSIALSPTQLYAVRGCGPLAWIFDAKDCTDVPIDVFSHDVSISGAAPTHSSQFLDGAILTFIHVVAFDQVGDFLAADVSTATYSKHVIGKLRQTKIEEYTRTSESGASSLISKEEYENGSNQ